VVIVSPEIWVASCKILYEGPLRPAAQLKIREVFVSQNLDQTGVLETQV